VLITLADSSSTLSSDELPRRVTGHASPFLSKLLHHIIDPGSTAIKMQHAILEPDSTTGGKKISELEVSKSLYNFFPIFFITSTSRSINIAHKYINLADRKEEQLA